MGISHEQALNCFRSDDLIGLGMEADALRRRLHPEGVVSYALLREVPLADTQADGASLDRLCEEIRASVEMGSTGVRLLSGGLSARGIEWLERVFGGVRQRFPSLWVESLSATEIVALAASCGLGLQETIARLRDAGLSSIVGDREQCSLDEWIEVHAAAHSLGMQTVATMSCGAENSIEQRVDLLAAVRQLQQKTNGFTAFVAQSLPSCKRPNAEPTAVEQLKTLAIARIFLDNIANIQAGATTQSLKVLQMGLRFGANDAGSVTPDESSASEEDLRRIIRDAGFQPVQRDALYRTMFLN
ncbi:MAG: dehypoxanthine futalosine cyclase [Acidobacteriaceae bacterium]|nr:dehypoxanthine futalosine cyclase [Acidobacteriaceae bacterium]